MSLGQVQQANNHIPRVLYHPTQPHICCVASLPDGHDLQYQTKRSEWSRNTVIAQLFLPSELAALYIWLLRFVLFGKVPVAGFNSWLDCLFIDSISTGRRCGKCTP
jgi:hypothetical protein